MKMKKLFSAICASAVLMSSFAGVSMLTSAETAIEGETEAPDVLPAPQNLREDDGYLIWDEVEGAYGYYLKFEADGKRQLTYYECTAEVDRLCYEGALDFGEYTFMVCAFKEDGTVGEWSEPITAKYAPTLDAPSNVRLDEEQEETVVWDEVEGAARYNIRIYNDGEDHTLCSSFYMESAYLQYRWYVSELGDYWISVQSMDKDYNVSEWTEPIKITRGIKSEYLDAPQNVRLNESGDVVLWDAVEGADYYWVYVNSITKPDSYGNRFDFYEGVYAEEPRFENWKSYAAPNSDDDYAIHVYAHNNEGIYSDSYGNLITSYTHPIDEHIELPENITEENGSLKFDPVEGAESYWINIKVKDKILENYMLPPNLYGESCFYFNHEYPKGTYDVEFFVVDKNQNYNSKTYSVDFNTVHDETVWAPKLFYKFENILWDYDRLRHNQTRNFWVRVKDAKDGTIVDLERTGSEYYYGLPYLPNGDYTVETCVYEYTDKIGNWSEPLKISKHGEGLFDKENETTTEVETPPEAEDIPEDDRVTSITINPAFNMKHKDGGDVELDLTKIKIKAKEIYDEEGLKRASEALGETISGNKHYNLLDLTLLYDEEDFSNGYEGLVQVIIPIPKGHRDKKFSCYRLTEIDGKMTKEEIPGEQTEDSYIVYLEHFSEYALVGDGGEDEHTHAYGENWLSDKDNHWKECSCGDKAQVSAHSFGDWEVTTEATESAEGSKERSCGICGYKQTETVPKLTPTTPDEPTDEPSTSDKPSTSDVLTAPSESVTPSTPSESDKSEISADDNMRSSDVPENSATDSVANRNPSTGIAVVSLLPAALAVGAVVIFKKRK